MRRYCVVIVCDLSEGCEAPDADRVVRADSASAAAKDVLRSQGSGYADCIEVYGCEPPTLRVRYLYCNLHAGEFSYDVCSS